MTTEARLLLDRAAAVEQLERLTADFAAMVDASESSNADDEHDPEGATIGFERAQLAALIEQAQARVGDVERAIEQVRAGAYGRCESCGEAIAPERLAARPAARTCIHCARQASAGNEESRT